MGLELAKRLKAEKSKEHDNRMKKFTEAAAGMKKTKGGRPFLNLPSMETPAALEAQRLEDEAKKEKVDTAKRIKKEVAYMQENRVSIDRIKYPAGEFAKRFLEGEEN